MFRTPGLCTEIGGDGCDGILITPGAGWGTGCGTEGILTIPGAGGVGCGVG